MRRTINQIAFGMISCLLLAVNAHGQRISFGLYATDGITLAQTNALDFNTKQPIILANQTVTVILTDGATGVLTILGRADLDVTVTIDPTDPLYLDVSNQIPLAVSFAYSNTGAGNESDAKLSAIVVPSGFTSITFPIFRRASGLPAPPPTPNHAGYTGPTKTAYLFVYGILGSVPSNAAAGLYSGTINVHVEYSTYP